MKHLIFLLLIVSVMLSAGSGNGQGQYYQGYYGAYPGYYGQNPYYSAAQFQPGYPGYGGPQHGRGMRLPDKVDISGLGDWQKANPEYIEFIRERTKEDYGSNPQVEIWLEKRLGRVGDYWFEALGGKKSHPTPKGTFTVKSKYEDFYSRKYDAEMPFSVFFTEQCAIHVGSLRVLSHGCIHVERGPAKKIFALAKPGTSKVKVHP